jgi:hypothetical protein
MNEPNKLECLSLAGLSSQLSLMFVCKTRSLPKIGAHERCFTLVGYRNIRLGHKDFPVRNALAYLAYSKVEQNMTPGNHSVVFQYYWSVLW